MIKKLLILFLVSTAIAVPTRYIYPKERVLEFKSSTNIIEEEDPVFLAHSAYHITDANIDDWQDTYVSFLLGVPYTGANSNVDLGSYDLKVTDINSTGNTRLGDTSTDTITCIGRWIPRTVAADPTSTPTAGTLGEIVFYNDKWYGKTVATGTDTNWVALNP